MKSKLMFILEIMWLCIAISSTGVGIYNLTRDSKDQAIIFLVIAFISTVMYFMRRKLRESMSKHN